MPAQSQPSPDWLQYLWYLGCLILGGLVSWIFKEGFSAKDLLAWWNRPKLSVAISDPIYTEAPTILVSSDKRSEEGGVHRYYHLDVRNSGATMAASCEAELVAVEEEESGQRKTVPSSTNLCFLHWGRTPLDCTQMDVPARIFRRRPSNRLLDVCTQEVARPGVLHIFRGGASGHADGLRTDYGPGTYYFTVSVRSTEHHVRPAAITIRIEVDDSGGPFDLKVAAESAEYRGTTEPTPEQLLVEYQAAQNSAQHHDSLIWSINGVVWAGSLVLLGFTLQHAATTNLKYIVLLLSVVGILLNVKVWTFTYQLAKLKKQKYRRCKTIEKRLGLRQHRDVRWASGRQKCFYSVVMAAFIIVWMVVATTALLTKAAVGTAP